LEEAVGDESNLPCLHARASPRVAQVAIPFQVASQENGVVNVHNTDMVMYLLSTSTSYKSSLSMVVAVRALTMANPTTLRARNLGREEALEAILPVLITVQRVSNRIPFF
jgi:hypothetical protein